MESNKEQENFKLKSMLQKIYSAFSMIYSKLNSLFSLNRNNFNSRTTFQHFSKMPELQNPLSKVYHNFVDKLFQSLNFLFPSLIEKSINRNESFVSHRTNSNEKKVQNYLNDGKEENITEEKIQEHQNNHNVIFENNYADGKESKHTEEKIQEHQSDKNVFFANCDTIRDCIEVQNNNTSLFEKALKSIEMSKSTELNTVMSQAQEFKGTTLSNDEISVTERILELIKSQQFFSNFMESNSKILTNSLTARGGFQGGAVMPGKDSVQRSINSKVEKIKEIMDEIKKLQNEMKDTVEKGLKV